MNSNISGIKKLISSIGLSIKRCKLRDLHMATVRLDQKSRALIRAIPDSYHSALAKFSAMDLKISSLPELNIKLIGQPLSRLVSRL